MAGSTIIHRVALVVRLLFRLSSKSKCRYANFLLFYERRVPRPMLNTLYVRRLTPKVLRHAKKRVLCRADTILLAKLSLLCIFGCTLYTNLYGKEVYTYLRRYGFENLSIYVNTQEKKGESSLNIRLTGPFRLYLSIFLPIFNYNTIYK